MNENGDTNIKGTNIGNFNIEDFVDQVLRDAVQLSIDDAQKNIIFEDGFYLFPCPHCGGSVQVAKSQINCKIFRHAVFKTNLKYIPPHSTKEVCDDLFTSGAVYGCAKPFLFDGERVIGTDVYN